mgnify:CR=1 FL=1
MVCVTRAGRARGALGQRLSRAGRGVLGEKLSALDGSPHLGAQNPTRQVYALLGCRS